MKKKFLKKAVSLALAGAMTLSLAGCGNDADPNTGNQSAGNQQQEQSAGNSAEGGNQADAAPQMEDTTIKIRVMNEFRNLDKVLAKYEEMTKDDPIMSKIHPEFVWVAGGDYKDKLTTAMIGNEDFDLMFCGSWHGLSTFIQDGNFADLSSYFNNDAYPGLQRAFSDDFVQAMTSYIRQEDGSYISGIYGINLATFYEDTRGYMYREDLRKKYDCAPITDEASLLEFVKTVQENEEGMIGVSLWNFFRMDSPWYSAKHDHVFTQDNVNVLGDQTWVWVGLSDDNKTVLNAVFPGDSAEEFAKMPAGYQEDFISEYIVDRTKWNPYLNPNRGGTDTVERPAAMTYSTLSEYESKVKTALEANPDEEYGFYVTEDAQRNMEEGAVVCDMVTGNWLVVPEWSEKTDATMYFLDWMFGSQEAHDLFELGIEGEDWEAVGADGYKKLDIDENSAYSMPTYSFTQNPTYIRVSEFVSENPEIKERFDYMYDTSTYSLSPLSGFVFDTSNVETQIANVSALSNELQLTISMYDADEAVEKINQWHADATEVGLEEIRAELISQIQAFLDAKNAN